MVFNLQNFAVKYLSNSLANYEYFKEAFDSLFLLHPVSIIQQNVLQTILIIFTVWTFEKLETKYNNMHNDGVEQLLLVLRNRTALCIELQNIL